MLVPTHTIVCTHNGCHHVFDESIPHVATIGRTYPVGTVPDATGFSKEVIHWSRGANPPDIIRKEVSWDAKSASTAVVMRRLASLPLSISKSTARHSRITSTTAIGQTALHAGSMNNVQNSSTFLSRSNHSKGRRPGASVIAPSIFIHKCFFEICYTNFRMFIIPNREVGLS